MGSTQDKNSLRRVRIPRTYRDMTASQVGNRLSDDLRMLRDEINRDRAIDMLPAPTGLRATSMPAAVFLEWNELPESFRKSIDGARIWRAPRALLDDKNWHSNPNKTIIVQVIRSTTYSDPVGASGAEYIYWVQWINLDGKPSDPSAGTVGMALWDSEAPGPLENLVVTGGDGKYQGSWLDPLTNINTLDGFAQQYSSTSGYTTAGGNICVTWWLGKIYNHQSVAPGETLWFRYSAHNQSGDAETNPDPRLTAIFPDGWGPWTEPVDGNPVSSGWDTGPDTGPPDTITVDASANGLTILFGAQAMNNQFTVAEGEIRIKAAANAAQTTADLNTPDYTYPGNPATQYGSRLTWPAPRAGRYFYSWRLRNEAFGWSAWTGDPTLNAVPHYIDTNDKTDIGPPQDWTVTTMPGPDANSIHVKTTRPKINGENLLWVSYQIRDTSGGQPWRAVDDNVGAAVTYYDGSSIDHKITDGGTRIYRESGTGFGSAGPGHLILLDVRGGAFHRNYCQWGQVTSIQPDYIEIEGGFRPQVQSGLRLKIVKYPHTWDTEGYLGNLYGRGQGWDVITNTRDAEFVSAPIPIDGNYDQIDARAWFENHYSRSDASGGTGAPTVSDNRIKVVKQRDDVIPGAVIGLNVTGADGKFTAKWSDPTTGYATIDDTAIQYTTDPGFTINGAGSITRNLGHTNLETGLDPGKTYYFRVAVHNQSDKDSDPSTATLLGPKGWGPWAVWGSPSPVSSGSVPGSGGAVDTVLPGIVQNLAIRGSNGEFIADWDLPATGYQTVDEYAIMYADNAAFANPNISTGWAGTHQQSTVPNQTYWFKVAAHNQSGLMSESGIYDPVYRPTGWGPWTTPVTGNPVSSGGTPIDAVQLSDNLVYNGGFELDGNGDGKPDGWILWEGQSEITWGNFGTKIEGAVGLGILNAGLYRGAVASDAFPVVHDEKLWFSCWAIASANLGAGLYIRVFFHPNDMNFTRSQSGVIWTDIVPGGSNPPTTWTKYEAQIAVPAGMGYARVALYNYASGALTNINHHFDDVMVQRRISGDEILDNTIPSNRLDGTARTEFVETFDEPLADFWTIENVTPANIEYYTGGIDGGMFLRTNGGLGVFSTTFKIPYDPRKLYKMTTRVRLAYVLRPEHTLFYMGVRCFDKDGANLGDAYPVASAFASYPAWADGNWHEVTGWFKGAGTGVFGPAPDALYPTQLPTGTVWISPKYNLMWQAPAGGGDLMDIDDIRIEIQDEQLYTALDPNGSFVAASKVVTYPDPSADAQNAKVTLYWNYTQGTRKAANFSIYISDGVGGWVERVKALPHGGVHSVAINRVVYNKPISMSVTAEAVGYSGAVAGAMYDYGTFTPNVSSGSPIAGATPVGLIEWAGGSIWFESYQYRNNIPPTNPPGGGITVAFPNAGSGSNQAILSGLTSPGYTQGPNIATHFAVLIKAPAGTIDLNRDMVVARISLGSLTPTFTIPLSLANNGSFTVAVVAVALTKHGATPHPTFAAGPAWSKNPEHIFISTSNAPRQIWLGNPESLGDEVHLFAPMRMTSPNGALLSYASYGGAYQGGFFGNSAGIYMENSSYKRFAILHGGTYPLFGFNMNDSAGLDGGLMIGNSWVYPGYYPSTGGWLLAKNGAGTWVGTSGSISTFGPAGPHCEVCGYDFWLIDMTNAKWKAVLRICGWCGAVYRKGPAKVLAKLTKQERSEIIHVEDHERPKTRIRRRVSGRRRKPAKGNVRHTRSRKLLSRR